MKENCWYSLKLLPTQIFTWVVIVGLVSLELNGSKIQAQEGGAEPADPAPADQVADFVPRDLKPVIAKTDLFFNMLAKQGSAAAYPELFKGSSLMDKPGTVEAMIEQTDEALKAFGNLEAFERIDLRRKGARLVSVTYLGACTEWPIQWNFVFYYGGSRWRILDIKVTNEVNQMIDRGIDVREKE